MKNIKDILFISERLDKGGAAIASKRIINCLSTQNIIFKTVSIDSFKSFKDFFFITRFFFYKIICRILRLALSTKENYYYNKYFNNLSVINHNNVERFIGKEFKPDLIFILWFEYIISLKEVYALKKKYNCEVAIFFMDNFTLTGGCRYLNNCKNYLEDCKNCLALKKPIKQHANKIFLENKKYYHLINPITFTPSEWSKILTEEIVTLNKKTKVIKFPVEKIPNYIFSKTINSNKRRTFLCAIQNFTEARKGWIFLYYSLLELQNELHENEMELPEFIFVGHINNKVKKNFKDLKFKWQHIDYIRNRSELDELYKKVDLVIVPSIHEWGSITTNEALSVGVPVLLFDTGSAKDLIIDDKLGLIIKYLNVKDMKNKLKKMILIKDEEMFEMKNNCISFAKKELNFNKISLEILQEIQK